MGGLALTNTALETTTDKDKEEQDAEEEDGVRGCHAARRDETGTSCSATDTAGRDTETVVTYITTTVWCLASRGTVGIC